MRTNSIAVISDVSILHGEIASIDFERLLLNGCSPGYSEFVQFQEGDHEYANAILKAKMWSDSGPKCRINVLEVNVDVPDKISTGTSAVSISGSFITFATPFYEPPEVNASIKGGTTFATPRVSGITQFGFFIEILDSSEALVAGTVTWAAHGY